MASQTFSFVSVVRGHYTYKSVWAPLLGECLSVRPETGNNHDKYAVTCFAYALNKPGVQTFQKYALNGGYALNNDMCLTTGLYGNEDMYFYV